MIFRYILSCILLHCLTPCFATTHPVSDLSRIDWNIVAAGDTLLLTEAQYDRPLFIRGSGLPGRPVVVRPAGESETRISVGTAFQHAMVIEDGISDLLFQNIVFEGGAAFEKKDATVHLAGKANRVRFENCTAMSGAANGFFGEKSGGNNLELIGCTARYNARRGVVAPGRTSTGFLAEDCAFEFNEGDGLLVNSSGGRVIRCRFSKNGYGANGQRISGGAPIHGIYVYPHKGGGENWLIQDCIMQENRGSGIRLAGKNNHFVQNTVFGSPTFVYVPNLEGGSTGNVIAKNRFYDISTLNELRPRPDKEQNFGPGIQVEGSVDLRIEDNDIVGAGISIAGQSPTEDIDSVNSARVSIRRNRIEMVLDDRFVDLQKGQDTNFISSDNVFVGKGEASDLTWAHEAIRVDLATWKAKVRDTSSIFLGANEPSTLVSVRLRAVGVNDSVTYRIERVRPPSADGDAAPEAFTDRVAGALVRRTYRFAGEVPVDQIRVWFINDSIDRDLNVDYLEVNGIRYETETPTTYSTGTWSDSDGCAPGYKERSTLHCPGYFQFVARSSPLTRVGVTHDPSDALRGLLVYPNPSDGAVIVQLPTTWAGNTPATLRVLDGTGREVHRQTSLQPGAKVDLDLKLRPGLYLIDVYRAGVRLGIGKYIVH